MNNINSQDPSKVALANTQAVAVDAKPAATKASSGGKEAPAAPAQSSKAAAPEQPSKSAQRSERVEKAVAQLNDYVQSLQRDLRFSVDKELGQAVVSVIDRNSQEVIRQIPNETALELARNLKDQQRQQLETPQDQTKLSATLGLINTRI